MTDEFLNLDSYLERIEYTGGTDTSEETLRELHIAHTLNIPFENLDVYYGKPVLLDEVSLFNKIVKNFIYYQDDIIFLTLFQQKKNLFFFQQKACGIIRITEKN